MAETHGALRDFIAVRPGATMPKVCNAVRLKKNQNQTPKENEN